MSRVCWCSTSSSGTGSTSARWMRCPTFAGVRFSNSASAAGGRPNTPSRWPGWRWPSSTACGQSTTSTTGPASGSSTRPCSTTSAPTSASSGTTGIRTTSFATATCGASSPPRSPSSPSPRGITAGPSPRRITRGSATCRHPIAAPCGCWGRSSGSPRRSTAAATASCATCTSPRPARPRRSNCRREATPSWNCGRRTVSAAPSSAPFAAPPLARRRRRRRRAHAAPPPSPAAGSPRRRPLTPI